MTETWHRVVKKDRKGKKDSGQHGDSIKSSAGPLALQQAFSQWSALEDSHETKHSFHASSDTGNEKAIKEYVRHRHKSKKEKKVKMSFDEVAGEVDTAALVEYVENKKRENSGTPMVWLKDMTNYIQTQFREVQVESDYSFLQEDPAYPASVLGSTVRSYIISLLRFCPSLILENLHRDCIDCLSGEVKGGRPSYGTRIVIQLLRESRPEVCSAASERIHLLLQSCGTKIPEILSLLWAGLPHPKLYPVVSLGAWDSLCLPFLYEIQGVPKPVLIYCLKYTSLLLRSICPENRAELSRCLLPAKVASVLSSPSIVIGRSQNDVQEILQLLKDHVLSDEDLLGYFSACFIQLGHTEHKHLLMDFVVSCIHHSSSALSLWSRLAESHVASSQLLLEYLDQHWTTVGGILDSATLATALLHAVNVITVDEHRQLCQNLLTRLENEGMSKDSDNNRERNCGCDSILCVMLTTTLAVVYMGVLAMFLLHVATQGPELELKLLISLKSPSDWSKLLSHATNIMWECVLCFLQLLEL